MCSGEKIARCCGWNITPLGVKVDSDLPSVLNAHGSGFVLIDFTIAGVCEKISRWPETTTSVRDRDHQHDPEVLEGLFAGEFQGALGDRGQPISQ